MRPLRAAARPPGVTASAGRTGSTTALLDAAFGYERAMVTAFFAARMAMLRWSVAPRDRAAWQRALHDERRAALREITMRRRLTVLADRDRRAAGRQADRLARQRARSPP